MLNTTLPDRPLQCATGLLAWKIRSSPRTPMNTFVDHKFFFFQKRNRLKRDNKSWDDEKKIKESKQSRINNEYENQNQINN